MLEVGAELLFNLRLVPTSELKGRNIVRKSVVSTIQGWSGYKIIIAELRRSSRRHAIMMSNDSVLQEWAGRAGEKGLRCQCRVDRADSPALDPNNKSEPTHRHAPSPTTPSHFCCEAIERDRGAGVEESVREETVLEEEMQLSDDNDESEGESEE